jgi:hypothetical protein
MKISSLKNVKSDIKEFFNTNPCAVFRIIDLKNIFQSKKEIWKLAKSTSERKFINFLTEENILKLENIKFPYRNYPRYIKNNAPVLEIAVSLIENSYCSHYTSMFLHELTEQIPKTIYVNFEQPEKAKYGRNLTQKNIDIAFSRPWRISNNLARYSDYNIYILNGMYTGNLGVIKTTGQNGQKILMTDLERTLIDIAVRPIYSGGIFEVLKAYRSAMAKIDLSKLIRYLKILNFIYPYYQAIGFYLEKAGYPPSKMQLLEDFGINFNFYLTHQIKNLGYSKKWRLYYPEGF